MNNLLKCECAHCGQNIEYPSEGTGQTVQCPTCEMLITLTPQKLETKPDSNPILPAPSMIEHEAHQTEPQSYVSRVRSETEKLRFFGHSFDENITKGQASDALDVCANKFPSKNYDYYNRPATKEQLATLKEINKHPDNDPDNSYYELDRSLTYGEAKDMIQDWELERQISENEQFANSDLDNCIDPYWEKHHWDDDYEESERGQFDQVCFEILHGWDFGKWGDLPTRKQAAAAWELVKSKKSNKAKMPTYKELILCLKKPPKSRNKNSDRVDKNI